MREIFAGLNYLSRARVLAFFAFCKNCVKFTCGFDLISTYKHGKYSL